VNRAAVKVFGYKDERELVGKNINIIVGGGHAQFHDSYVDVFRETGQMHKLMGSMREVPARRKDGSQFLVCIGLECVEQEGDESVLVAFVRDNE
jgi:two-component system sensor kinase FixL